MNEEIASKIKVHHKPIVRWTLLTAGTLLLGIGILGIFLPLLPTTVFFLMAAWCYARSSQRFYDWLHHNRYFGKYLKDYREGKGVSVSSKITTIVVLWGSILYSVYITQLLLVQVLLLVIAIGVTVHVVMIQTSKPESIGE